MKFASQTQDLIKLTDDEFEKMHKWVKYDLDEVSRGMQKEYDDCNVFEYLGSNKFGLEYNSEALEKCREYQKLLRSYQKLIEKLLFIYDHESIRRFDEDFGDVFDDTPDQITDEEKETLNFLLNKYKPESVV